MKKIALAGLLLVLLGFAKKQHRGKFKDYAKNAVVLAPGARGEWDAGAIGSVSVIKVNGLYHIYYEAWGQLSEKGTEEEYETLQIGHATSTDGIHWKKDPANPVIRKGEKGSWSQEGVWDPFVIYENGLFKLWFGCSDGGRTNWAYATSRDGSHFEGKEQISHLGNVEDDHVVHNPADGKYYMFYWDRAAAPWDSVMKGGDHQPSGLFVAVSNDETHFDFDHARRINVEGQQWPVKYSHVIKEGNEWIMFYGQAVTRGHSSRTGIATSTDLVHWTKRAFPVVKGHDAEILKTGEDSWYLYYAPDSFFDMPGANVRLATYKGKLSALFEELRSGADTGGWSDHAFGQTDFRGYYTKIATGQDWEAYSRTGKFADIIVRLGEGELVFWRGNSYLPYWKTKNGQWSLDEIIPRSGDGDGPMPDKVNTYSHVEFIKNDPSLIMVHWRYLANFNPGNPHRDVSPNNFVDELFTITADGRIKRTIKKGTIRIDDWKDPLNQTTQVLQLTAKGITRMSRTNPQHTVLRTRISGNPLKGKPPTAPSLSFAFDEGMGNSVKEGVTKAVLPVGGPKTYWKKGVSGTALEFDGYNTVVSLPAGKSKDLSGGSLTLEGWFALGAYPWNWAPLVQQGDNEGYFLGVDSHGYPGFKVKVDGIWEQLTVPNKPPYNDAGHLKTFRWYYMAGTYSKTDGMMRLYVNGEEVAGKQVGKGGIQTVSADVRIGKAGILSVPTEGTHDTNPSEFGIDGLIDEVRIYNVALSKSQIAASFAGDNAGKAIMDRPDMQERRFPVLTTQGKFKAIYTHLPYYETWDNLFRFGAYPDVVVGFDQLPTKFVFWRGVSFIPMMVNGSGQWFTEEFNETGGPGAPGDCEPMSDKPSLESHVRVIENNSARVVVEWRYRLANPDHHWAHYDSTTGWGDIADWYFYIYPDGVASVEMRCYSSNPHSFQEWNEQIAVFGPGQHPESVLRRTPVMTLVDSAGKATGFDWDPDPPKPRYAGNKVQMINFTGRYSPFAIQHFNGGTTYSNERTWYSVFPTWNHWPIGQTNSSGRNVSFPDRAAHSSISNLFWPLYSEQDGKTPFREKLLMEGMTDLPADSLATLADSWLAAPTIINVSGGTCEGYDQPHRAYGFTWRDAPLVFDIAASDLHPIHNVCFEIRNWKGRKEEAKLKIDGKPQAPGPGFRQGINIDTDGTYTLVMWAGIRSDKPVKFEITDK